MPTFAAEEAVAGNQSTLRTDGKVWTTALVYGYAIFIGELREHTPNEGWSASPEDVSWYAAAASFAVNHLGAAVGRKRCLIIGSPMFEAAAIRDARWTVTYLDVRQPPLIDGIEYVRGDITALPFEDNSFEAISSTCVLCHVGLGRYGDKVCENGDRRALKEIARVLKPGGSATIMFGPMFPGLGKTIEVGNIHRIYNLDEAVLMAKEAGLECQTAGIWHGDHWLDEAGLRAHNQDMAQRITVDGPTSIDYCYLSCLLRKHAGVR